MEMLGLILLIVCSGIAFIALLTAVGLLLPGTVEKSRLKLETSLGKAFLVGLVNLLSGLGINALFLAWWQSTQPETVFWLIIWAVLMLLYIVLLLPSIPAMSALAQFLGMRMGESRSPLQRNLHGSLLLVLACLTPYVGWFVFAPFAVCVGLGASIQTLSRRKTARAKA